MSDAAPAAAPTKHPSSLCGYAIERVLGSGAQPSSSYVAIGPGGRRVVLKRVDEDCLLHGALHPSIHERLSRVRELAHGGVANLHGVEREHDAAFLIWEYVEGQTFGEFVSAPGGRTPRDLMVVARELILSIDSMHLQGIVHGAISAGNVIVYPDRTVRLTHVSPLLYTDVAADVEAMIALLQQAVRDRGEQAAPLGLLLNDAAAQPIGLRALGARVAALIEAREEPSGPQADPQRERRTRRRMLFGALLLMLLGGAAACAIWWEMVR